MLGSLGTRGNAMLSLHVDAISALYELENAPYILNKLSDPEFFKKCSEVKRKLGDTVLCNAKTFWLNTLLGS